MQVIYNSEFNTITFIPQSFYKIQRIIYINQKNNTFEILLVKLVNLNNI